MPRCLHWYKVIQMLEEELTSTFHKYLQNTENERMHPNSRYEVNITPLLKSVKAPEDKATIGHYLSRVRCKTSQQNTRELNLAT